MKYYWTTATGKRIPISELKDSHLINIINMIDKYKEEGLIISSSGGFDPDEFWYDEEVLYGQDVIDFFDRYGSYKALIKEKKKRKILLKGETIWRRKKIQKSTLVK